MVVIKWHDGFDVRSDCGYGHNACTHIRPGVLHLMMCFCIHSDQTLAVSTIHRLCFSCACIYTYIIIMHILACIRCMYTLHAYICHIYIWYVRTYIYTYIHTCIHAYIRTCIHTYIRTYVCTYVHTYKHTHIHTYTYTCTHTICCLPYIMLVWCVHLHTYTYNQLFCAIKRLFL